MSHVSHVSHVYCSGIPWQTASMLGQGGHRSSLDLGNKCLYWYYWDPSAWPAVVCPIWRQTCVTTTVVGCSNIRNSITYIPVNAATDNLVALVRRVVQQAACLMADLHVVWQPLYITYLPGVAIFNGGSHTVLHHGGVVQLRVGIKNSLQKVVIQWPLANP